MATATVNLLVDYITESENQPEVTANSAYDDFDGALAGELVKALSNADYTLADPSEARWHMTFKFTGALTGNHNIIVPTSTKLYVVQNATTGGHNLTVKTASGTGIAVAPDTTSYTILWCDGTNVIALTSSGGGSGTLAGDSDVTISSPTDGQALIYNGTAGKWENTTFAGAGTLAGLSDVNLGSLSNGDVLTYDTASNKWINQAPSGGSGGVPSGTPVVHLGNQAPISAGSLGTGNSLIMKIPGRSLMHLPSSWKLRIQRGSGSHFSACVVLKTAIDSFTVVSSTAVTFGSSATPTLSAGLNTSDAISLTLDTTHDYWVIAYNDSGDSSFWGIKPCVADGGGSIGVVGGYMSGDQTGVSTIPNGSLQTGFGMPWDAVLAA